MRAPALTCAPASMKLAPAKITPSSIRASGDTIGFERSAVAKIPPEKRPSNMSWCTWMYFSGVPMSIQ